MYESVNVDLKTRAQDHTYRIKLYQLVNGKLPLPVPLNHLGDILDLVSLWLTCLESNSFSYLRGCCVAFDAAAENLPRLNLSVFL